MSGVKQILLDLEKTINKNQELRLKYSTDPTKLIFSIVVICRFEESEYALHEQIKKCNVFVTEPRVYPILVKLDFISTLSYLLTHENIVISADVVSFLYIYLFHTSSSRNELVDELNKGEEEHSLELLDIIVQFNKPYMITDCRLTRTFPAFSSVTLHVWIALLPRNMNVLKAL